MKTTELTTTQVIEAINNLRENTSNNLIIDAIDDCLAFQDKGYDSPLQYIEDVLKGGCASGIVGKLIYYHDTKAYYCKFASEIDDILEDDSDAFKRIETPVSNWLAWYGYETAIYTIMVEIENFFDIQE